MELSYYSIMRVSTKKKGGPGWGEYSKKMRITYWGIVGLAWILVLGMVIIAPMAQDITGVVDFEAEFTKIGLQYRFNNGWADQFSGKIIPLNESALFIEWYKYDDDAGFMNSTFYNPEARSYEVELKFYLDTLNQTGKTTGIFYVHWYDETGIYWGSFQESGNLVIRDNTRSPRPWTDILKARKYSYSVGDLG